MYDYCIAEDADDFWCATYVDSEDLQWTEWGFCTESCPFETTINKSWPTISIIAISVAFLISIVVTIAYCHLRRKKKNSELLEKNGEKEFDVFISYSSHDKNFVEDVIGPELENETSLVKYKCILHVRDFKTSISIMDQIDKAIDSSTCTIIALSKDFLKSQWAANG